MNQPTKRYEISLAGEVTSNVVWNLQAGNEVGVMPAMPKVTTGVKDSVPSGKRKL